MAPAAMLPDAAEAAQRSRREIFILLRSNATLVEVRDQHRIGGVTATGVKKLLTVRKIEPAHTRVSGGKLTIRFGAEGLEPERR